MFYCPLHWWLTTGETDIRIRIKIANFFAEGRWAIFPNDAMFKTQHKGREWREDWLYDAETQETEVMKLQEGLKKCN